MERVHFQQEQFLSDLKQLVKKEILTTNEAKTVLQRRSEFERALVRRIPKKSDFLRYIDYESNLDKLCRLRAAKTKTKPPHTRQFQIFERALKKFKDDVGLWIQYIQVADKHSARSLVSRISARAIQLHPTYAPFYILAAAHELENGSPAAARTLLQRGIRLNETSIDLWREYVKMELVFAENLGRRWDVLGIPDSNKSDVVDGAIVRSVMDSAFKVIPTLDLFHALEQVLAEFPPFVSHLYCLLDKHLLPHSADALRIFLARTVRHDMDQLQLVDAMKLASDKLVYCVAHGDPDIRHVVSEFVDEWLAADIDENLKEFVGAIREFYLTSLADDVRLGVCNSSMLQYTVVPPTLANSALDNQDYYERLTAKHNISSSSSRSPYVSPKLPAGDPLVPDDVFAPGDAVKEGGLLQGEPIRLVSVGPNPLPPNEQPASEFEVVRRLGAGSYAVVYLVLEVLYRPPPSDNGHTLGQMDGYPSTIYGREYAIKCLSKADLDQDALAAQMSEVTIHQSLRPHPNIVTLHRTLETSSFLLLLLEYVPGEDLFYFLEQARDHYENDSPEGSSESSSSRTPPTPSLLSTLHPTQLLSRTRLRLISSMFSHMCDAVAACHDQQVFHRDIKPENFIVTDAWSTLPNGTTERKVVVKLTDFGLSTTDIESSDMDCGSAPYMSYECRNNIAPTYRPRAADVWSLGIVLINMLYHFNPWTDTAQSSCSSFDLYRQNPVNFFLQRFAGMTRPVAQFLADRVFNILENDGRDDSKRISAKDFGDWVKDLPDLLGPPLQSDGVHRRHGSVSSTTGHPIASSIPPSHRPSSRQATPVIQPRTLAGLPVSRPPSLGPVLAPSLNTAFTADQELLIEEPEEELEQDQEENITEGMTSRSTSTNKRRKRGARKGKGSAVTPTAPRDETLDTLAHASQTLAREISRTSKASSKYTDSLKSGKSGKSNWSAKSGRTSPPTMFSLPTALLSAGGPAVLPTVPPIPPLPPSVPTVSATTQTSPLPVTKKPSKWKLSFGKANSANLAIGVAQTSPVEEFPPPSPKDASTSSQTQLMSATASNVTTLIMGLNAPPSHSAPVVSSQASLASPEESVPPWSRGRRAKRSSPPATSSANASENWNLRAPRGFNSSSQNSLSSSPSRPYFASSSPHASIERGRDRGRWNQLDNEGRAVSPSSARAGRHAHLASSASSVISTGVGSSSGSSNWRNSVSSAGTSTSAFTHYSNSSLRSVSTTATSVSSNSWRNSNKSPTSPNTPYPAGLPKNIKVLDHVPWELTQLPRGQHPNPDFGKPPVRKARTRRPKDTPLGTINERAPTADKSPEFLRQDASTSTTDLGGTASRANSGGSDEGDWHNKKVQRGQINALAKMLSALRR